MSSATSPSRRLRWTTTVAAAAALLVLMASAVFYASVKGYLKREIDGDLQRVSARAAGILAATPDPTAATAALEGLVGAPGSLMSVEILGAGIRAGHLRDRPGIVDASRARPDPAELPGVGVGHDFRGVRTDATWQGRPVHLLTTMYLKTYHRRLRDRQLLMLWVTLGGGLLAFAVAWGASTRIFGPLEEAYRRESSFAADVAHELRTPLTALSGEMQVALGAPRTLEEHRAVLASALEEVRRLTHLVNHLLFLARADAGQERLTLGPVDAAALCQDLAEAFGPLAEEKGLSFAVEVPPALPVRGDLVRLRQALANLLDNALRHTVLGGIRLEASRGGGGTRISVSDTGPGIAPEHQAGLFGRFHRVPGSPKGEGSGLGLALVKWVAEAHGGRVAVESAPGRGSRFTLILPG